MLMCPVCREQLTLQGRTWRCEHNHSFDLAKQGYVNLHVVQHKHSKTPGDTVESVTARRAFLEQGHYLPLKQCIENHLQKLQKKTLLDIGCGEGYYTNTMQTCVDVCVGVDIAKTAIQRASKCNTKATWVVGTGAILPVLSSSVDICTSLFSPIPTPEILRVLKDDGYLLVATPAPMHLYAMREALFEQVNAHTPDKFVTQLAQDFELVAQEQIDVPLQLNQTDLKNLIAMTPYAYKAKADKRKMLEEKTSFTLTASFQVYVFKRAL